MNETQQTELIALNPPALAPLFKKEDGLAPLLAEIEKTVRSHAPDTSTKKGRDAIASLAAKVARTKTTLDGLGKDLNAELRESINAVDAERRKLRDRLDSLKVEARQPLTDWEEAEEKRKAELTERLNGLLLPSNVMELDSETLLAFKDKFQRIQINDTWAELQEEAQSRKDRALSNLETLIPAAKKREDDAAELERLRKAEAERKAIEEEQRRKAEEAERKAEAERREKEAAEKARKEAEEAAARAAKEAEERHQRELEEAKRREEAAREEERAAAAAREAELKRAAEAEARERERAAKSKANRARVAKAIAGAVAGQISLKAGDEVLSVEQIGNQVADAILQGFIPHVEIVL